MTALVRRIDAFAERRFGYCTAAVLAAGVALMCLRRPTAFTRPGLYAEDGAIFLAEALDRGLGAILHPYNGYVHLVPRLVAELGSWLPIDWTPQWYAAASASVAVASCSLVLNRRFAHLIGGFSVRTLGFVLLLLIPRLTEVHLAVNSLLWWCAIALVLVSLLDDPATPTGRIAELTTVPILVMSGLGGLVLAPLALLRALRTRTRHGAALVVAWWVPAAVQAAIYLASTRQNGHVPVGAPLARSAIEKVFGSLAFSRRAVDGRWAQGVPPVAFVALVLFASVWAVSVFVGTRPLRNAAIAWTAVGSLIAGFMALGPNAAALPDRYTVLPIAAVIIGLLTARPGHSGTRLDAALAPGALAVLRWTRVVMLVAILVVRVLDVEVPARADTHWSRSANCLRHIERTCLVPLNPAGWSVTIPAGRR
ncbi:MAG: hypothetical protein R2698_00945 [Microthrixaceae bacterium]